MRQSDSLEPTGWTQLIKQVLYGDMGVTQRVKMVIYGLDMGITQRIRRITYDETEKAKNKHGALCSVLLVIIIMIFAVLGMVFSLCLLVELWRGT